MVEGDNEYYIRYYFEEKFNDKKYFEGKSNFKDGNLSISVDETITTVDGYKFLIEVDSYNMAKVVVGQYTLLNQLYRGNKSKSIFFVIHDANLVSLLIFGSQDGYSVLLC